MLLTAAVMLSLFLAMLFGSAGRIDLPFFWIYFGIVVVFFAVGPRLIDPGLFQERLRPAAGGRDRHLRVLAAPLFFGHLVVAGLDVGRWHATDTVPFGLQVVGLVWFVLCLTLSSWALKVNRFFSPVIRIQSERGHVLVTAGPYHWIRHPGYVSAMCMLPASALALGSWWSMAFAPPVMALLLRRTIIEDSFLHENLEGYAAYAESVRFRLLPGIW